MKGELWTSGQKVVKQDVQRAEQSLQDSIELRMGDNFVSGILPDVANGLSLITGATSTSVTVSTGVAYNSIGERVNISDQTIPYDSTKPNLLTPDGIGGFTNTPQSTGSANIPITSGVVNLVYVLYLTTTNPNTFSLHKITNQKLFVEQDDGYILQVVNAGSVDPSTINIQTSAPPIPPVASSEAGGWLFVGLVDFRAGGSVSQSMINTAQVPIFQVGSDRTRAITPKADHSDATPLTNYNFATNVTFDQHVKAIGAGAVTANNPHGTTLQDLGFTGKSVEVHEEYLHASGIVNGIQLPNAGNSLNLKVNPRCPDLDELVIYGLSTSQFLLICNIPNGSTTLSSTDLFSTGTLVFSFVGNSNGTYYIWANSTTRAVEIGTTAPNVSETNKFPLWQVDFNSTKGSYNISSDHFVTSPGGPCAGVSNFTNLVDLRLFGTTGSVNLQRDGATDTFTIGHNVAVQGNVSVTENLTVDQILTANIISALSNTIKTSLSVQSNAVRPDIKVDVDAGTLAVQGVVLTNVDLTGSIVALGANGLDTGFPTINTWYAIYVITNDLGSTSAALLSASGTSPTLPLGYTKFRRVGWVRNNSSGVLTQFMGVTDWIYYTDATQPSLSIASGTYTPFSFGAVMPPTSRLVLFNAEYETNTGTPAFIEMSVPGTSQSPMVVSGQPGNSAATVNVGWACATMFATDISQNINITVQSFFSFTTVPVNIFGYYDPV